ncbi:MAG: nickel insertion protein [Thalassotalea sp.]
MQTKIENSHIHLDIVGGIAGDMFISAMLDTFTFLQTEVFLAIKQVLPENIGTPVLSKEVNSGISGLTFKLKLDGADNTVAVPHAKMHATHSHQHEHSHTDSHDHTENHSHPHEHDHHQHKHNYNHDHQDDNSHDHEHDHVHSHSHETTYRYLCQLIQSSKLSAEVANVAIEILTIIAHAEAKIHDKILDDVHFHELADWDSLMDVVAAAVILHALSASTWSSSKLPLGGGFVNTQHGLIPVPAPATAEILLGFEFFDDNIKGERITPTGAAILKYLYNRGLLTNVPQSQLVATGYGLGTKVFPGMPNILRAMHFNKNIQKHSQQDTVVIIEFDIDDMTGEELGLALDLLRAQQGVIDVTAQSARGKKNRAVELIRILAASAEYQDVIDSCFNQTTTIGLRYRFETRRHLPRTQKSIDGHQFKSVQRPNGEVTHKIEHDELTELTTLNERRAVKGAIEHSLTKRKT